MTNLTNINVCEVCDNTTLIPVLNLGEHPLCDDLIPIGNSSKNSIYPIDIKYCAKCYTAHQTCQIPKKILFPSTYHYRARFTKDVLNGMKNLVDTIQSNIGSLANKTVLDIGCNDGSLLNIFKTQGAITYGIEPTDAYLDATNKGHVIINNYFDESCISQLPTLDVITFTNVFAHIEDLNRLLNTLKLIISNKTYIVIENHYLGGILDTHQFDTFYHEHPRTYSLNSFIHIAEKLNMEVISIEFPSRYGGNIRVILGNKNNITKNQHDNTQTILDFEQTFVEKFKQLNVFIDKWKINKKDEILSYAEKYGKIVAKALPARAAIPFKLLNLNEKIIECVYEKPGSMKIGNYVPYTRVPIRSDDELIKNINEIPCILNNAWHISTEIKSYLTSIGFKGTIINII